MTDRVSREIEQRVLEEITVAVHDQLRRTIEHKLDSRVELESIGQVLEQLAKRDLLTPRLLVSCLGARKHEQRGRKSVKTCGLVLDVAKVSVALFGDLARSGLKALDRARDRRQRCPQFEIGRAS